MDVFELAVTTSDDKFEQVVATVNWDELELNQKDEYGKTPLAYAIVNDNGKIALKMLLHGASLMLDGINAFQGASYHGKLKVLNTLCSYFAIDDADRDGNTPLHLATAQGHDEVVEWLLHNGANAGVFNRNHATALILAAAKGQMGTFSQLLVHGQQLGFSKNELQYALLAASKNNHHAISAVIIANISRFSKDFMHLWLLDCCKRNNVTAIQQFFDSQRQKQAYWINKQYHYSYNLPFQNKESLLMVACHKGHFALAKLLVERGAKLTQVDSNKEGVVHHAVRGGNVELVQWLLEQGIVTDKANRHGQTPLDLAESLNAEEIAASLRQSFDDTPVRNKTSILSKLSIFKSCIKAPQSMVLVNRPGN